MIVAGICRVLPAEVFKIFSSEKPNRSQNQNISDGMYVMRQTVDDRPYRDRLSYKGTKNTNSKKRQDLEPRAPAVRWFHISPPHIYSAQFMTYRHIVFPHIPRKSSFLMNGWGCVWAAGFSLSRAAPPPPPPPPPPSRPRVGVNEAFYVLPCRRLRYMLDMSRFVRN